MIMHKCNYMYMYNYYLALHSDGGEGRNAGSGGRTMICDVGRRGEEDGGGVGGREVREGEIRGGRRCGATASERDSVNAREGWKGRGGEERSGG